jgi:hypothetical protein
MNRKVDQSKCGLLHVPGIFHEDAQHLFPRESLTCGGKTTVSGTGRKVAPDSPLMLTFN